MTTTEKVIKNKLGLLELSQQLGNVSRACKIKAKSPQRNGICERFNRTVQNEFYAIAFRKKIYTSIEQLQAKDALREILFRENTHADFSRRNRGGKEIPIAGCRENTT